jgi:hypothetical protein
MSEFDKSTLLYKIDAIDMANSLNKYLNKNNDKRFNYIFDDLIINFTIEKSINYLYQISVYSNDKNANIQAIDYINELYKLLYNYKFTNIITSQV